MFYSYPQEVLQEVPGEISLALSISGCPLRCKGCHSTETYKTDFGNRQLGYGWIFSFRQKTSEVLTLDNVMLKAIREQATSKKFKFKKK